MTPDEAIQKQIASWFRPLNTVGAAKAFPPALTLSKDLKARIPHELPGDAAVDAAIASHFMTAAVDIWLRGVHSFLISAALTDSSPIWAAVVGYYSSHYTVRGLAHLLGHFQLFNDKALVRLRADAGGYVCGFVSKHGADHEHKFYWKMVKRSVLFQSDGLFTENPAGQVESDVAHRNYANYSDHLGTWPPFAPLSEQAIKDRVERISKISLQAQPLPRTDRFPDLEYVQLAAYHRIVAFRDLVDNAIGQQHKFWKVHRNPSFVQGYIDFLLPVSDALAQLNS